MTSARTEAIMEKVRSLMTASTLESHGTIQLIEQEIAALDTPPVVPRQWSPREKALGLDRCDWCGWPIVDHPEPGCWEDNCSMRPMPEPKNDVGRLIFSLRRELRAALKALAESPPKMDDPDRAKLIDHIAALAAWCELMCESLDWTPGNAGSVWASIHAARKIAPKPAAPECAPKVGDPK